MAHSAEECNYLVIILTFLKIYRAYARDVTGQVTTLLSGKSDMVKSCCAVGCTSRFDRSNRLSFYRMPPEGSDRRKKWIAAIRRVNWVPGNYSWVCSRHFINGKKSNDPLSPDYVPSVFDFVPSEAKEDG